MFENFKLNTQIKKSAQSVQEYADLTAEGLELLPERDKLQLQVEQVALLREACKLTRGPAERYRQLDEQCRNLESRRDAPSVAHKRKLEAKANEVRRVNSPAIQWFSRWVRETLGLAPHDDEFVRYALGAIHEVEAMSMKPLAEIMQAIETYRAKIDAWPIESKTMMPALSFRDLVFA